MPMIKYVLVGLLVVGFASTAAAQTNNTVTPPQVRPNLPSLEAINNATQQGVGATNPALSKKDRAAQIGQRLEMILTNSENLLARAESRIAKLESAGQDVAASKTLVAKAKTAIAQAKTTLGSLGQSFASLQEAQLKTPFRSAMAAIKAAHMAVVEVIRSLKPSLPAPTVTQ